MKLTGKDIVVILVSLASLAGVAFMLMAEGPVLQVAPGTSLEVVRSQFDAAILPTVVQYSLAFGLMLLVLSLVYILLVGREDDIITSSDEQK